MAGDIYYTGCRIRLFTWVGLTLISLFHHLPQLYSRFCQIPIRPGRIGQTVEHSKYKSTQPSQRADGTLCCFAGLAKPRAFCLLTVSLDEKRRY